ncbi:MAG TPA: uroporphyrinogen-III synthase [Gammaproteobacteria bacterium]|nr:uroporphyrinogen-III synthase [Gammaproteobacteria bacterium]
MNLSGLSVVITRPAGTGAALAAELEARGAAILHFPAIVIEPLPLDAAAADAVAHPDRFDLVICVSPSAAAQLFATCSAPWPATLPAAGVGPGTAAALRRHGIENIIEPAEGAGAEALLAVPALADLHGKRILIAAGIGGRNLLNNTLRARGAEVATVRLYRRVPPQDGQALFDWLGRYPDAILLVTSIAALDHLTALAADGDRERLLNAQLVVPSPRVVKKAAISGYRRVVQAADASDTALIEALEHWRRAE